MSALDKAFDVIKLWRIIMNIIGRNLVIYHSLPIEDPKPLTIGEAAGVGRPAFPSLAV